MEALTLDEPRIASLLQHFSAVAGFVEAGKAIPAHNARAISRPCRSYSRLRGQIARVAATSAASKTICALRRVRYSVLVERTSFFKLGALLIRQYDRARFGYAAHAALESGFLIAISGLINCNLRLERY
jgi:hypothetical protein